jgi:hypothetical protein
MVHLREDNQRQHEETRLGRWSDFVPHPPVRVNGCEGNEIDAVLSALPTLLTTAGQNNAPLFDWGDCNVFVLSSVPPARSHESEKRATG